MNAIPLRRRTPIGRPRALALIGTIVVGMLVSTEAGARPKRSILATPDSGPPAVGKLLRPTNLPLGDATALGVVIDTSGSMRDPKSDRLSDAVISQIFTLLDDNPGIKFVQLLDADGRFIARSETWLPVKKEARPALRRALDNWKIASNSNPVPGMIRFLGRLNSSPPADQKIALCVLGDELSDIDVSIALERLERKGPLFSSAERHVTIHAIMFPLPPDAPRESADRLHEFLAKVTAAHGGSLMILQ